LKVALQTIWEDLPQEHNQQGGGELHQVLDDMLWLTVVVTPSIYSNSLHLQVRILISLPTNRLFSEPPTNYQRRQRSEH